MTTSPTTSAGPSLRVEPPPPVPPPRPRPRHLVGILLAGAPTFLFATLMAGALAAPFLGTFRPAPSWPETIVFSVFPGIGLAVFARRWWLSIRALDDGAPPWAFLFVPFFVVAGVATAVAAVSAMVRDPEGPGASIIWRTCREHPRPDDSAVARCEGVGRACAEALLAEGHDTAEALEACVRDRGR
jgi:hypothetical protein